MLRRDFDAVYDAVHLLISEGAGHLPRAHETRNSRRGMDQVPSIVVHVHLHQNVAGIKQLGRHHLLALPHFNHVLGGNHDLAKPLRQSRSLDAAPQGLRHFLLETRISVNDVPVL